MSEKLLFPVFTMPETEERAAVSPTYRPAPLFDFDAGDFARNGAQNVRETDGRTAYLQWCRKMALTERYACACYGDDMGIELEAALKAGDRESIESEMERTITEALLVNPRTQAVTGFEFVFEGDALHCSFVVRGRDLEDETIDVAYTLG